MRLLAARVWDTHAVNRIRRNVLAVGTSLAMLAGGCASEAEPAALFVDAPQLFDVPSVVGKTVQFAAGVLSTIGSPAIVEVVPGLDGVAGTVVEQLPRAGTLVTLGSPVVLKVPGAGAPSADRLVVDGGSSDGVVGEESSGGSTTTVVSSTTNAPLAVATTAPSTTIATTTHPPHRRDCR